MPPMPNKLHAAVRAASSDGRYWGAWPNGNKPGVAIELGGDAAAVASASGNLGSVGSVTDLLTLNPALNGASGYRYWDINAAGASSATYLGAFRFPDTENTGTDVDFFYSLPAIGVTAGNKMLAVGHGNRRIAEINIPTLSKSTSLASLARASYSTAFFDPVNNAPVITPNWGAGGPYVSGIKTYNGRVMVNVYANYDGSGAADRNLCVLNSASAPGIASERGFFTGTADGVNVAHSGVWISEIPAGDKAAFGGTHVMGGSSGNKYRSINLRNAMGPTAFVYDANASDSVTGSTPAANGATLSYQRLMDFSMDHVLNNSSLGSAGQQWSNCSEAFYGFLVPGTDTYMVLGFNEGYNTGISYYDPAPPWPGNKGYGPNAETDVGNWVWFFKKSDLLKVKSGEIANPWDLVAYEHARIILPLEGAQTVSGLHTISGGDFDLATNRLWLSLLGAEPMGMPGALPVGLCFDFSSLIGA